MENISHLAGRQWLSSQLDFSTKKGITKIKAVINDRCSRCNAKVWAKLPNGKRYCRECIGLGRVVEGDYLIRNEEKVNFPRTKNGGLTWSGKLTTQQEKIAQDLVKNYMNKQNTLVHAVTGAGKTEMMFPLIAHCLAEGKRCCIAAPRIDVVNELFPRLQAAFTKIRIGKYHGHEYQEPGLEQLTICTTHQLLKFFRAFDLLIIDEADSFPYVQNPELNFASKNALKNNGQMVYLTATPTKDLLKLVKKGQIQQLKLNRRFHGYSLPVPKEKLFLRPFLEGKRINPKLVQEISKVIKAKHPLLLFLPRIDLIKPYVSALRNEPEFKQVTIEGVHANDVQRIAKVDNFRQGQIQLLVTTTILERGVTFNHVWVIVVQADDKIYNTSSLVQIAGRVGRSRTDPTGLILFCYQKYTSSLRNAMKQIREMNK